MTAAAAIAPVAALAQQDPLDSTGGRVALVIVALLVLAGAFVAGVLAFTGRWRSWYSGSWQANYKPLAAPWFAGALLLVAAVVGLDFLLDPAPPLAMALGVVLAMVGIVLTAIYAIHPPRRMLPKWIRTFDDDPLSPEARPRLAVDETLSRWKSGWQQGSLRKWLLVGFLGLALPGGLVYLGRPLWWYATGTPTTATVEDCGADQGSRNTVCWGDWALPDGVKGHGTIAGAGEGDVGKTLEVRASETHAATFTFRLVYPPVIIVLLFAGGGYLVHRERVSKRKKAAGARAAGTGPGPGPDPSS
ncbi:HPP family protein [Actinomadura bangladeshensis]|uniref:HPP family protein n=1 Tax=Actinomadura bangladeshensis TaxID=453573 RepID=A0A4R4NDJ6_9ACTN|nr:HPP family protein [Actinomadura bangladeshensis]TDC05500.1 HPP family protein [Actinomadura bangladeshensis]